MKFLCGAAQKMATLMVAFFLLSIVFMPSQAFGADLQEEMQKELIFLKKKVLDLEKKIEESKKEDEKQNILKEKVMKLEKEVEDSKKQAEKQKEEIKEIKQATSLLDDLIDGLDYNLGGTFVIQGTHNANGDDQTSQGEDVVDGSYSIDLEFEKKVGEGEGLMFLHLEAGGGEGVDGELKTFSAVNFDADDDENVRVTELWYELYANKYKYLSWLPLTVTFGKLDPTAYIDTNEYANDEASQFLGNIFRNNDTIEFADNALGIRFNLNLETNVENNGLTGIEIDTISMDGNSNFEDIFDDTFHAGQINFKTKIFGRSGNYRLIAWLNEAPHPQWSGQGDTRDPKYGFAVSADQEILEDVGIFGRFGWTEEDRYMDGDEFSLHYHASAGVNITGKRWKRENDAIGIAFGVLEPSEDYIKAESVKGREEGHIEAYYRFALNDHLEISPDVQLIVSPFGDDATNGDNPIIVGGLRLQLNF